MTTEHEMLRLRGKVLDLEQENQRLQTRIGALEKELEFLKKHPALARGLRAERLIADVTKGIRSAYAAPYDVMVGDRRLEVKSSKLNPTASATKRWSWYRRHGWRASGNEYDFLLLVGDKDPRFEGKYKDRSPEDQSPYAFFLLPRNEVQNVANGENIVLTTNPEGVRSRTGRELYQRYLVAWSTVLRLFGAKEI